MSGPDSARGSVLLVPNTLDFGAPVPLPLTHCLPLAVIERAAALGDWVVEDAKTARAFLKRVAQHAPLAAPLQSLDIRELPRQQRHNEPATSELASLLQPALAGHDIGVLSEAGLAAVADPGGALVAQAHALQLRVEPLPGASALMLALAASGLNGQQFAFVGYLPVKDEARAARIRELDAASRRDGSTQLAIETPYRNTPLLRALLQHLAPSTRLCVACALGWPDGWCVTARVDEWRASARELNDRLPAVFLFQGR
jgi:16S rRNA (cytidine1402-2'-O)-methyltransferase